MTRDYDKSVTQTLKRKRDRYTYVVEKKVEWKDASKLDDSNIMSSSRRSNRSQNSSSSCNSSSK